jgi:hypothetical protein
VRQLAQLAQLFRASNQISVLECDAEGARVNLAGRSMFAFQNLARPDPTPLPATPKSVIK